MKAIQLCYAGGPESLEFVDLPEPEVTPGKVLIKLEASGVNFIDIYQRSGLYKITLPTILGMEGAGTVVSVASDVQTIVPGDRVAFSDVPGAYAEYIAAPAERLVKLPPEVTAQQGAAVMLQGLTAHYLATSTFSLTPGQRCLIHAGAGGVGLLLTQIAKHLGATVFTTVSNEEKAELSRQAGADEVLVYSRVAFQDEIKRITENELLHVVYDSVGKTTFEGSLACLRPRGMLVSFGQSSGPVPAFDPLILGKGSLYLSRPRLGDYVADRDALVARANDLFTWIRTGVLKLRIDQVYPLEQAEEAHRSLEGRKTVGKVLLSSTQDAG